MRINLALLKITGLFLLLIPPVGALEPIEIPLGLDRRDSTTLVNLVVDSTFFNNSLYDIEDLLGDIESSIFNHATVQYSGAYSLNIDIKYLEETDHNMLVAYLQSIEERGGYELNTSIYDSGNGDTFQQVDGRSYDADNTLDWIADQFWDGNTSVYTLFLLNLEDLDRDELEHWFMIKPTDVDLGVYNNKFFSGTYGLDMGKQVSAWGGRDELPVHFLDISSNVWFGDFINSIWPSQYYDSTIKMSVAEFNDRNSAEFLWWLKRMVYPFFYNLFSNKVFTETIVEDYESVADVERIVDGTYNIPTVILVDEQDKIDNDSWIIHEDKMQNILEDAFPFLNFNISVQWEYLGNYLAILEKIETYSIYDEVKGVDYIEVNDGFLTYLKQNLVPQYFGELSATKIPSLLFFIEDMEFRVNGVAFSGLAVGGWQLQIINREKIYYPNGTAAGGFSDVLLHEIGHSLGLFHPFSSGNSWESDFTASIMGYYTSYPDFSVYEKDALARLYADNYIVQAEYLTSVANSERDLINGDLYLSDAVDYYAKREYVNAIYAGRAAIFAFQSPKPLVMTMISPVTQSSTETSFASSIYLIAVLVLPVIKRSKR